MQTGATTPNNVGSCKPTMLRPFARGEKVDRFQTLRNNTQQHPTTCNRMCTRTQHVTSNSLGSCKPTMLRPFERGEKFDRFQTLRNNTQQYPTTCNRMCKRTQHVTSNNVGSSVVNKVASVCTQRKGA